MKIVQNTWQETHGWLKKPCAEANTAVQLVLVFASSANMANNSHILQEVRSAYPNALLAGCSTSGEIQDTTVAEDSFAVTAIEFANTAISSTLVRVKDFADSKQLGSCIAKNLQCDDLRHVFIISDGLCVNGSELAQGLRESLPAGVTMTGGLAGDGADFKKTHIIHNELIESEYVVAIGFSGQTLEVGYGSLGGWSGFGPIRAVTKSEGNVLHELDGKPALELYKKYLGDQAAGLPATALLFPLEISTTAGEEGLVRTILSIDEEQQTMTFAGDIPLGAQVQLMRANVDSLIDGARGAALTVQASVTKPVQLALLVSCVGRKLVMEQRTEEEVEEVKEVLGDQIAITGFYSYGELAPIKANGKSELHNQTCTITTFSE